MNPWSILNSDVREGLKQLPDESIQLTVTSPPYFRLRNYSGGAGEIGREATVDEYISSLVSVFRILKDKTKQDGLLFLNLGDSYVDGQLAGIPWRVALALQEVGWVLRSDIIWHKPNAMPSSIKNRPTVDHEYVFMFSKAKQYKYNQDAIREPHVTFSENSKMRGVRISESVEEPPKRGRMLVIRICMMVDGIKLFILRGGINALSGVSH